MKRLSILFLFLFAPIVIAQDTVTDDKGVKYPLGRVAPSEKRLREVYKESASKHAYKTFMMSSRAVPESFDCEAFGLVPPIKNQSDCGSCHIFSALGPITCANIKAGNLKLGADGASEQWMLDCKNTGGCNGGWEWDDAEMVLKGGGVPLESEYGQYVARSKQCKSISGMKLLKIVDMGMCSTNDGVAKAIDMQNCLIEYGPISVAVAADSSFSSYRNGLYNGSGSRSVNHAVMVTGWKTVSGKVYWKLRNSWGEAWGEKGYMWILAGANQVGVEAFWVKAESVNPPLPPIPPNPPIPPGPNPGAVKGISLRYGDGTVVEYDVLPKGAGELIKQLNDLLRPAPLTMEPPIVAPKDDRLDRLERSVERLTTIVEKLVEKKEKK